MNFPNKRIEKEESEKMVIHTEMAQMSGPLPPPSIMKAYNELVEKGAERIFTNFENQSHHRQKIEVRGQIFSFVLGIVILMVAGYLAYLKQGLATFGVIVGLLISLVIVFKQTRS